MSHFLQIILETIWLFLPAGAANMAPVFAERYHWFPVFDQPIHLGLFGSHKTTRGLVAGVIFGSTAGLIQHFFFRFAWIQSISLVPYEPWLFAAWLGWLLGFGTLAGDLVKSFFKRRLRIPPGKSWPFFDQVDSTLGAAAILVPIVPFTFVHLITAILIFGPISFLVSYLGIKLKLKKSL